MPAEITNQKALYQKGGGAAGPNLLKEESGILNFLFDLIMFCFLSYATCHRIDLKTRRVFCVEKKPTNRFYVNVFYFSLGSLYDKILES